MEPAKSGCFYAVAKGRKIGIYSTWYFKILNYFFYFESSHPFNKTRRTECQTQIKDFAYAKYRKFTDLEEAQQFIHNNSSSSTVKSISLIELSSFW